PPEYASTRVHHSLYLPENWKKGGKYPVIVEFTGNYFPEAGSSGQVQGASLGYGLSGGRFIWVVLPFIAEDGKANARTWWGDEKATVAYAKTNIPRICREYGGDPDRVFLCGFSRGAIAVNYIGLADDEIAALWAGFITHDHYDGQRAWPGTVWGTPLETYRKSAAARLKRLGSRPVLAMQAPDTNKIREYLGSHQTLGQITFLNVPMARIFPKLPTEDIIHLHNDQWLLFESPAADQARNWLQRHAKMP
ncbi:MAG: hypothetical protein ACKO5E_04890, partial [bacterium]